MCAITFKCARVDEMNELGDAIAYTDGSDVAVLFGEFRRQADNIVL